MRHLITIKNGITYDHRPLGFKLLRLARNGVNTEANYESVDNRRGVIYGGSKKGGRSLRAEFLIVAKDQLDLDLAIEEAFALFDSDNEMIIIDSNHPSKKWLVQVQGEISEPERFGITAKFSVPFFSAYPYSKSIGTSLDPLTFDSDLWQIGQGLIAEETSYRHKGSTFQIYNPSVIDIVPWEHPLVITIKGETKGLQLVNETTGDVFKHYGPTGQSDVLTLNKIMHLKNGSSCMGETNHKDITLAKGWNRFKASGLVGAEVSFDFPFYGI